MRCVLMIILYLVLVGCAPELNDLKHYTQQVKQATMPYVEPYPEYQVSPSFSYTSNHLPSPFTLIKEVNIPQAKHCYQPNVQRAKAPLEAYDINTLSFGGSISVNDVHWALVRSADGILHKVKVGDHIGLFYGKVTQVNDGVISIEQSLPDGVGCWHKETAEITTEIATVLKAGT